MNWIVTDIDGTLINSNKELSSYTKESLINLQKQGIKVVIASGRGYQTILDLAYELKLDEYGGLISCYNGGLLYDVKNNKIIYDIKLTSDEIKNIYDYCIKTGLNYCLYAEDGLYINKLDEISAPGYYGKFGKGYLKLKYTVATNYEELPKTCYKITFPEIDNETLLSKLSLYPCPFKGFLTLPNWMETGPQGIDKGYGVKKISEVLNLDINNAICFGDADNDIPMFEVVTNSVAMANGTDSAKQKAKYLTLSNDQDGIIHFLKEKDILLD